MPMSVSCLTILAASTSCSVNIFSSSSGSVMPRARHCFLRNSRSTPDLLGDLLAGQEWSITRQRLLERQEHEPTLLHRLAKLVDADA